MIILGIDPGIGRTGWGVVEYLGGKAKTLDFGCFETTNKTPLPQRLVLLKKEIDRLIKKHKPTVLGVEELFFNTNAKTAMIVGQARGVVIETCAEAGLEVLSFTPPQVKSAITGYGKADKEQVGKMVKMILSLKSVPKPDDTADALAIAVACGVSYRLRAL